MFLDFVQAKQKKPSKTMQEYVNTYLTYWTHIGNTEIFNWLMRNPPDVESNLTEMTHEHKITSYYDTSFIRGNNDWMYVISFGDMGICVFAFKIGLVDNEIMDFEY